jgi:hypothetical protein
MNWTTSELTDLERLADPVLLANDAGITPDPWQAKALLSTAQKLLFNCSRQSGKSTVASLIAIHRAVYTPGSLVFLVSKSLRQSGSLFRRKLLPLLRRLGYNEPATQLSIRLNNGSEIVCLPADPDTIIGDTVDLLIIDEASRVSDDLFHYLLPMLIVSKGRLICLSTPYGKRGFFWEQWSGTADWERYTATWEDCPRISAKDIADQRAAMGERKFRQEYCASFEDVEDSYFSSDEIMRAFDSDATPLFA